MLKIKSTFIAGITALLLSNNSFALEMLEEELSSNNKPVPLIGIKNSTDTHKVFWLSNGTKLEIPADHGKLIPCSEVEQLTIVVTGELDEMLKNLECGHSYTLTGSVQ